MIDTHCHLEQKDYDKDRDSVIERCKRELDAVITSSAHPKDWELTMNLVEKHHNFVFATASMHPLYIKEITEDQKNEYINLIRRNKGKIVAIGECGTDYWWIKDEKWREKQREMFVELINLSKELNLPLIIHSRNGVDNKNAIEDAVKILEKNNAERVQMHMFSSRQLLKRVLKNGWMVSINTLILRSKSVKKIVRNCPLDQLMLETDAPWLGVGKDGAIKELKDVRNEPTAVRIVAEKIAEVKKIKFEDVDRQTTENAIKFFSMLLNK